MANEASLVGILELISDNNPKLGTLHQKHPFFGLVYAYDGCIADVMIRPIIVRVNLFYELHWPWSEMDCIENRDILAS